MRGSENSCSNYSQKYADVCMTYDVSGLTVPVTQGSYVLNFGRGVGFWCIFSRRVDLLCHLPSLVTWGKSYRKVIDFQGHHAFGTRPAFILFNSRPSCYKAWRWCELFEEEVTVASRDVGYYRLMCLKGLQWYVVLLMMVFFLISWNSRVFQFLFILLFNGRSLLFQFWTWHCAEHLFVC